MSIIILFITIVIQFALCSSIILFIKKIDKSHGLTYTLKERLVYLTISSIVVTLLFFKTGELKEFVFLSLLSVYLIVTAMIDLQTMLVYRFLSYVMIAVGVFYIGLSNQPALYYIYVFLFSIMMFLFEYMGSFGMGDVYCFIAISFFLVNKSAVSPLLLPLINIIISTVIFLIIYRKQFNFKTGKMNQAMPFVPSIAISTIILVLIK